METVTKRALVSRIADKTGLTVTATRGAVQAFLDAIIEQLALGHRIEFREFGVFEVRNHKGRVTLNPVTGKRMVVPPRRVTGFKPGRRMRELVSRRPQRPHGAARRRVAAFR
ncbi:MAG: integration host factor subunit beta [Planctomycetes bacterium]|nr:integration host factor subunit beta [Planctomycetota bacterium]